MRDFAPQVLECVLSDIPLHCLLFLLAIGYCGLRAVYLVWLHPLSDIPGPGLAALTDLWKTLAVSRERFATELRLQHEKYGDVVRIGPNEVSYTFCRRTRH